MATLGELVPPPEVRTSLRTNAAPILAVAVGGPALLYASYAYEGSLRVRASFAIIGVGLIAAGYPQLRAEVRRVFGV